jgi:manganese efflux pump family protein
MLAVIWYTRNMTLGDVWYVLLIALSLSADCFALALGVSCSSPGWRPIQAIRTAFTFGAFQTLMPIIGWAIGRSFIDLISGYDHWAAFILLLIIGLRMFWEASRSGDEGRKTDITRGVTLIVLGVATSIDALAIGLSFAFLKLNIWIASGIIGVVTFGVTNAGFYAGRKIGSLFGKWAKVFGGVVLVGLGLKILITHLLS